MWYSNSPPEKARVIVELLHQDGGKTILKTVDLDARRISTWNREEEPNHLTMGMVDPFRTYEDHFRSVIFSDRFPQHHETFFDLNIQLEKHPDVEEPYTYTIQYIEKPTNQMVLVKAPSDGGMAQVTDFTEEEAAERAERYLHYIYFLVEIPG